MSRAKRAVNGNPINNLSRIYVAIHLALRDGDIVLVNMEKNYIDAQGGIYAIAINDEIMIKRLQPLYPEKKIKIISDNQKDDSIIADPEQIKVNGKVIWFARELEK